MSQPPTTAIQNVDFWTDKHGFLRSIEVVRIKDIDNFSKDGIAQRIDFFDLIFVTKGRGQFVTNDDIVDICPDQVYAFTPLSVRRIVETGLDGYCLFFEADFHREYFSQTLNDWALALFPMGRDMTVIKPPAAGFSHMIGDMEALIPFMEKPGPLIERYIAATALKTIYALEIIQQSAQHPPPTQMTTSRLSRQFLALVRDNFARLHKVTDYTHLLACSEKQLMRAVRADFGLTPKVAIQRHIVAEAKRQLAITEAPISDIALALGYDDPARFSAMFKAATQCAPRDYRRRLKF